MKLLVRVKLGHVRPRVRVSWIEKKNIIEKIDPINGSRSDFICKIGGYYFALTSR